MKKGSQSKEGKKHIIVEREKMIQEGPITFLNNCAFSKRPATYIRKAFTVIYGKYPTGLPLETCKAYVAYTLQAEYCVRNNQPLQDKVRKALEEIKTEVDKHFQITQKTTKQNKKLPSA